MFCLIVHYFFLQFLICFLWLGDASIGFPYVSLNFSLSFLISSDTAQACLGDAIFAAAMLLLLELPYH